MTEIDVEKVAARLKARAEAESTSRRSLAEAEENRKSGERARGHAAGVAWASDHAGPRHLKRLSRAVDASDGHGSGDADDLVEAHNGRYSRGHVTGLYRDIAGGFFHWNGAAAFWRRVLGDDAADQIEDPEFAIGFVEGAIEVWDAVVDHNNDHI